MRQTLGFVDAPENTLFSETCVKHLSFQKKTYLNSMKLRCAVKCRKKKKKVIKKVIQRLFFNPAAPRSLSPG